MPASRKLRADAAVEAHAARDFLDVGAGLLAHVGDLVDEADLGGEERVRGELDHLGARRCRCARAARRAARTAPRPRRRPSRRRRRSRRGRGCRKSATADALAQELRVGHVAQPGLAALVETRGTLAPVPTGTVDFITSASPVGGRQRVDHRVDGGEVGVAGVGGRRVRRPRTGPGRGRALGEVRGEVQAVAVALDELVEARARRSGSRRARRRATFSASMSMHQTSLPSSAKPAAVTRPT